MAFFFGEVKIFRFWPKTMDYSPWFEFWESKKSCEKSILDGCGDWSLGDISAIM